MTNSKSSVNRERSFGTGWRPGRRLEAFGIGDVGQIGDREELCAGSKGAASRLCRDDLEGQTAEREPSHGKHNRGDAKLGHGWVLRGDHFFNRFFKSSLRRSTTESAFASARICWMTVLMPRGPHWQPCLR